ncbi:MAG: excinuclease ABC subunit UvrC [Flavobacteriales bacterium]
MEASEHLQTLIRLLPHKPGVYQYFDADGNLLYVGKAKSLKNRVSSYFSKQKYENGKTLLLVRKIADLKTIVVETEMDALLLENSLIKKFKPRYNINLKDDKSYPSIVIKNEPFPRIFPTRQIIRDGSEYFGPYSSVKTMHAVLDLVKKLYPIRTCSLPLQPKSIEAGKFKVCLEYHLGNCLGPCEGKQTLGQYDFNVDQIRKIIRGDYGRVLRDFKSQLKEEVDALNFEKAQMLKERIEALELFQAKSTIVNPSIDQVDVFSIVSDASAGFVNYLRISNGTIVQGYTMELRKRMEESDQELLEFAVVEIRARFASTSDEVFVPIELDIEIPGVKFHIPQKGDKKKLLELSHRNAVQAMLDAHKQQEFTDPERHTNRILSTIQSDLHLNDLPVHMECFDNSNIQGTHPVSACVVFKNGKPSKSDYRKFNIRGVEGPNDFDTMKEVLTRRYSRVMEEGQPLPQLIVIDGGKGQLSAAVETLNALGLRGKVAVIGIAKRLEEIYFPGDSLPVYLDKRSETLRIIQHMRDEAHRFGISHHRDRRSKDALRSELTEIPGVGMHTTQTLLRHFKTVGKVKEASEAQLGEVINARLAGIVWKHFHP